MFAAFAAYANALLVILPHLLTLVLTCLFVLLVATICFDNEYLLVGIIVTFFACIAFCLVVLQPFYYKQESS